MRVSSLAMALAAIAACGDNGSTAADHADASAPAPDAVSSADAASGVDAPASPDASPLPDAAPQPDGPPAIPTAFKVTSLELLDPHVMAEDAGCRSADLTSFVNTLIEATFADADR